MAPAPETTELTATTVSPIPGPTPAGTAALPAITLPPSLRWIESWAAEPTIHLPEIDPVAALAALAPFTEQAHAELAPADPTEVVMFMKALADRHCLDLPDAFALELDAETLAEVPRVALRDAFTQIWKTWAYR